MDTGRVKQLLKRRDLKKGQTGEQLHSVLKPCMSFLNMMHFFNHYFGMQMVLALYNGGFREYYYQWWCKETCRCGMASYTDEVWKLKCTCNGAFVGLDPFRRFCNIRQLQPPPRQRPVVAPDENVNLVLDERDMGILRSVSQRNDTNTTPTPVVDSSQLQVPVFRELPTAPMDVDGAANSGDGSDSESDPDPEPHPNAERASKRQRLDRENRRDLS
jgi:hypothetical protein